MQKTLLIPSFLVAAALAFAPVALAATSAGANAENGATVVSGNTVNYQGGSSGTVTVDTDANTTATARVSGSFSANVRSGDAPLAVTFTGSGLAAGNYIVDYGDGANSGSIAALDTRTDCQEGSPCPTTGHMSVTHTYTAHGTYTATLYPYVACLWGGPMRCQIAVAPIGQQVTITVQGDVNGSYNDSVNGSTGSTPNGSDENGGNANNEDNQKAGFFTSIWSGIANFVGATNANDHANLEAKEHADDNAAVNGPNASNTTAVNGEVKAHGFFWNVAHLWGLLGSTTVTNDATVNN